MLWIALHHMTYFMEGTANCYAMRCMRCSKLSGTASCVCVCIYYCIYVELLCISSRVVEYVAACANVSIKTNCKGISCHNDMFLEFLLTVFYCSALHGLPKWTALGTVLNHNNTAKRDAIVDWKKQCSTRSRHDAKWEDYVRTVLPTQNGILLELHGNFDVVLWKTSWN